MRSLTEIVSESFIWGVGITRPQTGQQRRAAIYITAILVAVVLLAAFFFMYLVGRV